MGSSSHANQVWHQHRVTQMQLGLVQDDPPAGSPDTTVKGTVQLTRKLGRDARMRASGPWRSKQLTTNNLADLIRR